MACDLPEPYEFPSFDSCQKRFLWTHNNVDLAPHAVVGLVLRVRDAEKFPRVKTESRLTNISGLIVDKSVKWAENEMSVDTEVILVSNRKQQQQKV